MFIPRKIDPDRPEELQSKGAILGHVQDIHNRLWGVREIRATKHGFDLYYGVRVSTRGTYLNGGPGLILTKELKDFWEVNKIKLHGVIFDLPAGRTTLKRARNRLMFNHRIAWSNFWSERIGDLSNLSAHEFARRHGIPKAQVFENRRKILGIRARPFGWWRDPRHVEVLRSTITFREKAEKLGIGITHAKRLTDRARQLAA